VRALPLPRAPALRQTYSAKIFVGFFASPLLGRVFYAKGVSEILSSKVGFTELSDFFPVDGFGARGF
jgi:hypothetical protein